MAAASSNQPGAQNGPLVFTYEPSTRSATQVAFRDRGGNGLPAWERVIYDKYVDLRNRWINIIRRQMNEFRQTYGFALLSDMKPPTNLDHIMYKWKTHLKGNGTLAGYETVRIYKRGDIIPVIIFQPSWGKALYIVENYTSPNLDNLKQGYILPAARWWTSGGLNEIKGSEANTLAALAESNGHQGQVASLQPGAASQGGRSKKLRRTRRTRRK